MVKGLTSDREEAGGSRIWKRLASPRPAGLEDLLGKIPVFKSRRAGGAQQNKNGGARHVLRLLPIKPWCATFQTAGSQAPQVQVPTRRRG